MTAVVSEVLEDISVAPEGIAINTNLLDALREKNGFSLDQYGDLDSVIEAIRMAVGSEISAFSGEDLEIRLSNIAMFSEVQQLSVLDPNPVFVQTDNEGGQHVIFFSMSGDVFRHFLGHLFGSSGNFPGSDVPNFLSISENKLFLRFGRQICGAVFQVLEIYRPTEAPSGLQLVDPKELNAHAAKFELIALNFDFTVANVHNNIAIVVPLSLLQPVKTGQSDKQSALRQRKDEEIWAQTLNSHVGDVFIPLQAEISSLKMSLLDIANLKEGSRLKFEFDLSEAKIIDQDGNCTFLAEIDLSAQNTVLKVVEILKQNGA